MKEKILEFAKKLGFASKIEEKTMTAEDWQKFAAEFKKEHGVDILEAVKDAKKVPALEAEQQNAIAALFGDAPKKEAKAEEKKPTDTKKEEPKKEAKGADPNIAEEISGLKTKLTAAEQKIEKLSGEPEEKKGTKMEVKRPEKVAIAGLGHSKTHLFGIPADLYLASKPWNQITLSRSERKRWDEEEVSAFKKEFNKYGANISNRIATLHERGLLGQMRDVKNLVSIDYSGFDDTGWGEEYVIRRQDALISYIRSLPTVSNIFPVRYGVQNKMVMTNSFLTDFSQAYQSGHVFKGGYDLDPEVAQVDDAMFKHKFENLKTLEKEYVGYLNREGSDPIKWNFIEWLMIETLKKLHNEQEERRIRGYRVAPVTSEAGHHLLASTGVIARLGAYVDNFQLAPFTDLNTYTSSTILAYIESLVEKVNLILPSMKGYRLFMNEKHIPWYLAGYRTQYGTDQDFKGGEIDVKNYGLDGITGVPNMGNSCMMWITIPGNLELYEMDPGEMEKLYFQRDLESLIVASWWKEGSGGYMTGKKFASAALLAADNRKHQFIFLNDPTTALAAGATAADASVNNRFKTIANAGATAFLDFTNKEEGVVYRLTCGSATNATTIAKAALFSNLTAAWTPTAVGDYLEVYWNATTSKYVEVARLVTA